MSPAERAALNRFGRRLLVAAAAAYGFYRWQPYRFDPFPRLAPADNPWVDPESDRLFSAGTRVAIVTAHPDDSEFYLAGTLTQLGESGARISLIVATDGDKGYYPLGDAERNRRIRRQEQIDAARRWGGEHVVFLGYPDGRLPQSPELVDRVAAALASISPEYVLGFDSAYPPRVSHRDHRCAGWATEEAVRRAESARWLMRYSTIAPNCAVDVTPQWPIRLGLLRVHRTQFYGAKLRRVVRMITRSAEWDGKPMGVRYAEGFRCERLRGG